MEHNLKKALGPFQLWGLAVGLVISGEYFGWSYGWGVTGTFGFLIATVIMSVFFTTFIFSLTEFSTAIPHAGGPYAYAERALGRRAAELTAILTVIEFVFAPPAIAFALGSYLNVLVPELDKTTLAYAAMLGFGLLNLFSLHVSARFELLVTLLAVGELLFFIVVLAPHFQWSNFASNGWQHGIGGIFASFPFAIWLFLGIEGVAMTSEEVKNPRRDLPIGYISGIVTLIILAIGMMLAAGGAGDWRTLSEIDFPIPAAARLALGEQEGLVKVFAGVGLFGLIASLNGLIIGASRQLFAIARAGILPVRMSKVNRFASPHYCVLATTVIGILAIFSGQTNQLIIMSGIGATAMYSMCMVSLFAFRVKEPSVPRPFVVPCYPYFPGFALVMSVVSLFAMAYYNAVIFLLFAGMVVVSLVILRWVRGSSTVVQERTLS